MAKKSVKTKCLLGVLDECITEKYSDVSWSTNKIGGRADWIEANTCTPCCKICDRELCLVVQLYCPLDGSPYHRCIYLFGCINDSCWSNCDSWVAIRCQKLADSSLSLGSVDLKKRVSVDEWLENGDDWGDEEDNGNRLIDENHSLRKLNNQSWTDLLVDADEHNKNVIVHEQNLDAFRHLELNDAGNVEGAVGLDPNSETSAEMESPDEGTITLETPNGPTPETTSLLFRKPIPKSKDGGIILKSWFLAVVEEPTVQCKNQMNEHERDLLARYQKRDGVNFNEIYNRDRIDMQAVGESYEKPLPRHGDRTFHKLLSKLRLCPQQLLRYSRDGENFPLLVSPACADVLDAGKCPRCGDKRIFEFQLMPSTVDLLRTEDGDNNAIEFGVVIVYTCRASCWEDGDVWREERVVVQPDPDLVYFDTIASRRKI